MQTVIVTNNAEDFVLLIDANEQVVSEWTVTPEVVDRYFSTGHLADEWNENYPDLTAIADYGEEYGRNGQITDVRKAGATVSRVFQSRQQ